MPSGAKKRKAAKRKQKHQQSLNINSASASHPQGNGAVHVHHPPGEEPEVGKKESILENGKKEPANAVVDIGAKQMQGEVQVESVQPMEDALNILHSDLANEEAMPASEAITETSEATVHPEAENLEMLRVTETPAAAVSIETFETAVSTENRETEADETALTTEATRAGTPETTATTEKDIPPSLMHHRTRWWNCCGLFDVISG